MNTPISRRALLQAAGAAGLVAATPRVAAAQQLAPVQPPPTSGRLSRFRLRASTSSHRLGGQSVETWTYNGRLPGPLLRTRLGDRVVVDVVNDLPSPTTIHWHGVEVPAIVDGSSISQLPIPPGGAYSYEFTALTPGLFWYHPHVDTNEQVERGLYGALVVEDPAEAKLLGVTPANEHVLVLDDVLVEDGALAPPFPSDPLANAVTHFNGRIGNVLLVNGQENPAIAVRNGTPQRLRLVNAANSRFMRISFGPGQKVWRVGGDGGLLEAPLDVQPIDMVPAVHGDHGGHSGHGEGGDMGGGAMDSGEIAVGDMHGGDDEMAGMMMSNPDLGLGVMLTPGERADLIWLPMGAEGDVVELSWHDWPRGDHGAVYAADGSIMITDDPTDGLAPPEPLVGFRLLGDQAPTASGYAPPPDLRSITPFAAAGAPIALTMGHGPPDAAGEVTFFLQRDASGPKPFPILTPDDVATVSPGDVRLIEVTNLTMGAHNFHLHGFFFQLIETEYLDLDNPENNRTVAAPYRENKDTILIPPRPGAPMRSRSITRVAASFDDTGREGLVAAWGKQPTADRSGGWLMHCHLLEHSDSGMLSFVQVRS